MPVRFLRTILCVFSATFRLASGANTGMKVWAVGDAVRIDPVHNRSRIIQNSSETEGQAKSDTLLQYPHCKPRS